ncbi:mechanosensitive ion channel family protein [Acidobacteria bacterium AH-259-D05]|nr:mechanosensitive ion channel family protein [Acidobacteria bacterium AH-259-D05]
MNIWEQLTTTQIAGYEIWRILVLFISILIAFVAGRITRYFLFRAADHLDERYPPFMAIAFRAIGRSVGPVLFVGGLQIGLFFLILHETVAGAANTVVSILFVLALAYVGYCFVDVVDHWLMTFAAKTKSKLDDMLFPVVRKSLRITIILLAFVQIATIVSDEPITSILAGLGVGGLALALAAQDTLKNFFGSLMLFADKPFEMGDRIVVGGHDGPVEEVGLRSTRIRTLDGHLVTIPNGELAHQEIQNIGKRPFIKRVVNITVTYDTPAEKIEGAVQIIQDILDDHEGMPPDLPPRVFFNEFNDAALNILVIYWYSPPNYWDFLAFSQRINLEILRRFNQEGIEFAFPTQTLYLAGDPNRPLTLGNSTVGQ